LLHLEFLHPSNLKIRNQQGRMSPCIACPTIAETLWLKQNN
jgi:hypothetical protein